MMVNFGNRYSVLANLIRHLHDEVIRDSVSPKDAERFLLQISRLRDRLRLIGIIQSCAAISFVLALGAMIATYFDEADHRQHPVPWINPADDRLDAAVHPRNPDREQGAGRSSVRPRDASGMGTVSEAETPPPRRRKT